MVDSSSSSERPPGQQRQQFSNALEKYAIIFSLTCSSNYLRSFVFYSYMYGIFQWLVAYAVAQLIVGIPMFLLEYFIGQFSSDSIINMYSVAPALKGTGITNVLILMIYLGYGILDAGKTLVLLSYTFTMPWTQCSNYWNTYECIMYNDTKSNASLYEYDSSDSPSYESYGDIQIQKNKEYSSDQFVNEVLIGKDNGSALLWWLALPTVIVWILIYLVAVNGIRIIGKVALWTMVFRVGTTVVLLIVGLATSTELSAYFFLNPYLLSPDIWGDAVRQVLVMQQMGLGIITTIGSYDKFRNNCLIDALIVAVFNFMYPFIYGIFIMAFIGFLGNTMDVDSPEIISSNLDLGMIPLGLSIIPGHFLWVFLYALMHFTGKLGLYMIMLESVITSLMDAYPKCFANRQRVTLGICVTCMLISMIGCIGNNIGHKILFMLGHYAVYLASLGNMNWIIFIFIFLYGAGRMVRDIRHVLPRISWAVTWPCYLCWIVIIPCAYSVENYKAFSLSHLYDGLFFYPLWSMRIGEFITSSVLWFTTIYAIVYLIRAKGTCVKRLVSGFRPSVNWGPKEPEAKLTWEEYSKKRPICCGCSHPDCCTQPISDPDDVAIPLRVETTCQPGQPSAFPNTNYPRQPTNEKPEEINPGDTRAETTVEGLYPDLPTPP